ncbi:MAG TPA: hypothetical protein VNT52_00840 [Acidimicrobiales bacterium]|nr:hypothetical protein [Acidimicrobiales bacterium]
MKTYRVEFLGFACSIAEVEVERPGELVLLDSGIMAWKCGENALDFATWEDAHACLIHRAQRELGECERMLRACRENLQKVLALVE